MLFAGSLGRDEKTKKLLYQGDEQVEVRWPLLEHNSRHIRVAASAVKLCCWHKRVLHAIQPVGHVFYKDHIIDMVCSALQWPRQNCF